MAVEHVMFPDERHSERLTSAWAASRHAASCISPVETPRCAGPGQSNLLLTASGGDGIDALRLPCEETRWGILVQRCGWAGKRQLHPVG